MTRFTRIALSALCLVVLAGAAKINTPRVLLPWVNGNTRVNFTFEISEGGCYSWSLSRDDLVSLEAQYEDSWGHCSRSAIVSPLPACSLPGSVIILAEDVVTGEIIRGDLNVDRIRSVKIMSTTWKLYLEEAPEAFEVEAFDEHGNKFSTLEGIEFNWKVENKDQIDQEPFVKLLSWLDTDYEAPKGISEVESTGRHSYSVLLYADTMGEAKVTVCHNKTCDEASLRVVPSVILQPAIAIIAKGDSIRMKVVRAKKGKLRADDVSDTMYRLLVPDDGITYLEDGNSLIQGLELGTTTISLISGSTEIASSSVTVSTPHSIRVILRPSDLLVRNEYFSIRAIVLDKQGRALTAGENILVRLTVVGDANIQLISSTENGTVTDAMSNAAGTFTVTAYLHSVGGNTLSQKIQGSAQGTVVEPLQIIPPELFIAWTDIPVTSQLRYTGGGDGAVVWNLDQTNGNIRISSDGIIRAESMGNTVVHAHLASHPHVRAQAEVQVLGAQYIQVASAGGARVERIHYLHVALTGTHPNTGALFTFHTCNCNSLSVSPLDGPEPYNVTAATWVEPLQGACCVIGCAWRERGTSALRVSHGALGDTVRVLVREGPKLVWPQSAAMLLGARLPILASGESITAISESPKIADVRVRSPPKPFAHPDLQMFTVSCIKKGETTVELRTQSDDLFEDGGSSAIACVPRASRMHVEILTGAECPGGRRLWLRAGGRARLDVALSDAAGRQLRDEAPHRVSWETNPSTNAIEFDSPDRLFMEIDPEYDPVPVPLKYYQEIRTSESSSGWTGTIKATSGDVSASIQTSIVSPITATPQYVNIAWEGSTPSRISTIAGGSGHYAVEVNKGARAWSEAAALLATWPAVGRYELVVSDGCVVNEAVTVVARVEELTSVEIAGPRAICVDTCVTFSVSAHGRNGRNLTFSSTPDWVVSGSAEYREGLVCGLREGSATVKALVGGVWSREVEVGVFPGLRIVPPKLRLSPGARVQLTHAGGAPQRLLSLQYVAVQPREFVQVTTAGLLTTLRVGSARVRLVAKDADGAEVASTEAEVEVVGVTGVRVVSATSSLLVGTESPVWLEGVPELGASALAAMSPAPRVVWTLRDGDSALLTVPLRNTQSLNRSTAEGFAIRVMPLRDGPIIIDVHVDGFLQGDDMRSFNTIVELQAIPKLTTTIENKELDPTDVAVAVGATIQLKASLKARWRYMTYEENPPFELSPSGELRAIREGFGVAVGRYRDEKNNFDRQISVQIEVATPHYITTQLSANEDGTSLYVQARSKLGRVLIGHSLTPTTNSRIGLHRIMGSTMQVTGVDASGTFVLIEAPTPAGPLKDYLWLDPPERSSNRINSVGGQALCLQGKGWKTASPDVWMGESSGVTLVVLQGRRASRISLEADKSHGVTIVQAELDKLNFLPGEWPASLVPLSLGTSGELPIACDEEERTAVAGLKPVLPFQCVTTPPYVANAVIDTIMGQVGCSVSTDTGGVAEAREADVCAEWAELRACARVLLLPPVRVSAQGVLLKESKESFVVTGHPLALKSVVVSPSPGIKTSTERSAEGVVVTVWSVERECGTGWLWVRAQRTGQAIRIPVQRDCEATCGSLLAIIVSLVSPYLGSLASAVVAAFGALYVYSKLTTSSTYKPTILTPPSPGSPISPVSPTRQSTWRHSPYAPPRGSTPPSPVYGDTTLLADESISHSHTNSRFM